MNRIGLLASVVVLSIASASAADAPKPKAPEPGTSVEMPYLIAPVVVEGKLQANAYVSNKIIATSQAAAIEIRDKTPFIQDAFVRDVNAKAIGMASDPATIDQPGLQVRLLADARRIVGAGKVADLKIIQVQVNPIRPDASP